MSEAFSDNFWMGPCLDQERSASMAQPVQREVVRKFCFDESWLEVPSDKVSAQYRRAFTGSEYQIGADTELQKGFGLAGAMFSQLLEQSRGQWYSTARHFSFSVLEVPAAA